ncbi:hypothetical protein [Microbacterium allomyrinae]|uniref:Uncharacterized protein n=1 Tax=Microbacterium allomyrinae TaxID=2830666 RepID=A0A9X1LRG4_9MICO|nr:hypothetical protein [Microbacterium allomyrinae]MCC2030609.1 hypothetical protein [Microbacterium allomyrinae]
MWSFVFCNSSTGSQLLTVEPTAGNWSTGVNGTIGSGSHTFSLREADAPAGDIWRGLVSPWSRALVVCWDGEPVYAGLVTGHEWDRDSGKLTVTHDEFRLVLDRRLVTAQETYTPGGFFEVSGKSLRGLVRAVVARATLSTPGDGYHFPIVLPADEAGGETRRWHFSSLASAEKMLTEIQDSDGGPDVYFRPRWSPAGRLEWVLEIGTPRLTGPSSEWVVTAEDSPVGGVKQKTDALGTLTGVFGLGMGSDEDMRLGIAGGLGVFPVRLEATRSFKSVDDQGTLDTLSMGELQVAKAPVAQVKADTLPVEEAFPNVRVGSTLRLLVQGDEFMEDATTVAKVVGLSGDMTRKLKVGMQ